MNILTAALVVKYGFSTNIKNLVVFFIYFLQFIQSFSLSQRKKARAIFDVFFSIITVANTIGVLVSLGQFLSCKVTVYMIIKDF